MQEKIKFIVGDLYLTNNVGPFLCVSNNDCATMMHIEHKTKHRWFSEVKKELVEHLGPKENYPEYFL